MKYSVVILALLTLSGAIVQPHKQRQHQHQKYHEKRDVVWTTECIWVDGDATPVPPNSSTTTSHIPTTSTISSSETPVQFHESPTSSPQVPSTSTSVAPYVPPTPSTSSVYVPPAAPTSTYVAPVVDSVTSPTMLRQPLLRLLRQRPQLQRKLQLHHQVHLLAALAHMRAPVQEISLIIRPVSVLAVSQLTAINKWSLPSRMTSWVLNLMATHTAAKRSQLPMKGRLSLQRLSINAWAVQVTASICPT
jgi:hypothetical protein